MTSNAKDKLCESFTLEASGEIELQPKWNSAGYELVSEVVKQTLTPVFSALAQMLENNNQALNQLAATQTVQNNRLEALEKQIRLNTLVTPQQVKFFNDAIKTKACELLRKREIVDAKAARKLGNAIRKSVLSRYGVAALHEIPKHEYSVVLTQIDIWNDALCVRDVAREARMRNEAEE